MSYPIFYPNQYKGFAEGSLKILRSGEPGIVLVPPNTHKSGILVDRLIKEPLADFHLTKLDLVTTELEQSEDINIFIKAERAKSKKKKLGVFIINAQILVNEKKFQLLNFLLEYQKKFQQVSLIFYFNIDLTHPEVAKHLKTSIFGNIIYFPLYSFEDSKLFIKVLEKEWKISLSEDQIEKIVVNCGGYFWLVKQVVRVLRENPEIKVSDTVNNNRVKLTLEQFYESLFPSERTVLQSIILGRKIENDVEKHSLTYLEKIGLVENYKIRIPFLENYIRTFLPHISAEIRDNHIYINFVNVDSHFSQKEKRVFKTLIKNKSKLVTRDELAKSIWPVNTDEFYSDWAVDRILARLRQKIKLLGFSKDIIKTERNKGYLFVE